MSNIWDDVDSPVLPHTASGSVNVPVKRTTKRNGCPRAAECAKQTRLYVEQVTHKGLLRELLAMMNHIAMGGHLDDNEIHDRIVQIQGALR